MATSHTFLSEPEVAAFQVLQEVPEILWAQTGTGPCKNQYPMKKKAICGVTPVQTFEKSVIVPSKTTSVRTSIFPNKKRLVMKANRLKGDEDYQVVVLFFLVFSHRFGKLKGN